MLHVRACNPRNPFLLPLESTLIVWDSGGICKLNFYDRDEVVRNVGDLLRGGDILCPVCLGLLKLHGCYQRHCLDEDGERHDGWVPESYCIACDKYHAIIPSFIKPHKHYKVDVIERVVGEAEQGINVEDLGGCSADASTMRRWVREFKVRGRQAVSRLASMLPAACGAHVGSPELQGTKLLQQLARLLHGYPTSESVGVIGKVNIILTRKDSGFL